MEIKKDKKKGKKLLENRRVNKEFEKPLYLRHIIKKYRNVKFV